MPPPPPKFGTSLKGAELKRKLVELASTSRPDKPLDIYVTSSTGHQIREDGGSGTGLTGWRDDRNQKLKTQFTTVGAAVKVGTTKRNASKSGLELTSNVIEHPNGTTHQTTAPFVSSANDPKKPKQIFKNCTIYINGNTALSGVSDVELKRLLTSHGAVVSYHLARRQVTHIILTNLSAAASTGISSDPQLSLASTMSTSCGTSQLSRTVDSQSGTAILASRKIELEMKGRVKSKIHYVSVEWALASMKQEKRLAETKFPVVPLREARQGTLMDCKKTRPSQRSLTDMMKK
ncbi:hypothetical protein TWF225_009067 [Orbilia oligospora]|uniref:Uncharacterized protein n=1 Tax=Orbilia oligospora TaxID=2813651 RepID=A0A7C8PNA3_ORBOL|nr:hypothetical protein TWF225_009067 [Orbilia oligospora]KAF3175303.1 hypothetical protein TWF751_004502 [Orbilia oligospora]KAF3238977.1 hypothetical protein TWF217_001586 [Orbilia oligospora]KAF3239028.1 hypothetical protein TWF128_011898 [Orbilia oligospora]KAF3239029.1 hypothetical protein TWF128_011898 [Orbilia oligospora]